MAHLTQTAPTTKAPTTTATLTVPLWSLFLPIAATVLILLAVSQEPDGRLHLWVLDVGQGDAILLKTPNGHTALIDGGPGATPVLNGIGAHIPFWQRHLDLKRQGLQRHRPERLQ